jgi:hypothetical protein
MKNKNNNLIFPIKEDFYIIFLILLFSKKYLDFHGVFDKIDELLILNDEFYYNTNMKHLQDIPHIEF